MTDPTKFDKGMGCETCEAMCLDAVDGTLTAAEQEMFDRHVAGCVECAEQVSEAKRGAAWMEMLKQHRPEPPAGMLQRILAQTSEAEMSRVFPRHGVVPTPRFEVVPAAGYREKLWFKIESAFGFNVQNSHFQPRMAMTAAMAFFSIALTMNLTGIQVSDLKPGAIQRSVADARASMARSFQGMKVVYQVESRVNELREDDPHPASHDSTSRDVTAPKQEAPKQAAPDEKPKQDVPKGTSELILPGSTNLQRISSTKNEDENAPGADAPQVQRGA